MWLTVILGLTAHKKSQEKSGRARIQSICSYNVATSGIARRILFVMLSWIFCSFVSLPANWSYETFYWIQSCLLSRKNFILLTHELFKNYSIKCWLIVCSFSFQKKRQYNHCLCFLSPSSPSALLVRYRFISVCNILCNLK